MQQQAARLGRPDLPRSAYGRHFAVQVWLGGLLLLAVILSTRA
jgi:4-hydroxybenzoate polyprenyltransferase